MGNCNRRQLLYNTDMPLFQSARSYLYAGEITPEILKQNNVQIVDLITVELGEIGVKELRSVLLTANERPFGVNRLLWLKNAIELSDIIQNTLLKIIEEPPSALIIVLQSKNADELLPTLRSRLQIIQESLQTEKESQPTIPGEIWAANTLLRSIKERPELVRLLKSQLGYARNELLNNPSVQLAKQAEVLSSAISRLNQNCNQKLVIDALLLRWHETSGKA